MRFISQDWPTIDQGSAQRWLQFPHALRLEQFLRRLPTSEQSSLLSTSQHPISRIQDGIDLFLGNYRVSSDEGRVPESCPISGELSKKLLALPITMFLAFSMCIINLLIPADSFREQMTYILFWGAATMSSLAVTLVWGQELVDAPRLYSKVKRD